MYAPYRYACVCVFVCLCVCFVSRTEIAVSWSCRHNVAAADAASCNAEEGGTCNNNKT